MPQPCRVADLHREDGSQVVRDGDDLQHGYYLSKVNGLQGPAVDKSAAGSSDVPDVHEVTRLAVVLIRGLDVGQATNAAALLAGGLRCAAFREPVSDADGVPHVAVCSNVPVLVARSKGQLLRVLTEALNEGLAAVALSGEATGFSNDFDSYKAAVVSSATGDLGLVGVAIYGPHDTVRRLTRSQSVYR